MFYWIVTWTHSWHLSQRSVLKAIFQNLQICEKNYKLNFEQLNVYLTPHLFSWSVISEANLSELQYLQTNFRLEHRVF